MSNYRSSIPIEEIATELGIEWFDYQLDCFQYATQIDSANPTMGGTHRLCLYYKTGAGKSITALTCLALWDCDEALVIAPPSTHNQWVEAGRSLGIAVEPMSHAKFRMPKTQLRRDKPVIADEMHMFGGHAGKGWKKLDRLARGLQAPLILASATPNYNDADRVYCIQHILDPGSCAGGFLQFLYTHCTTEQNPFGMMPIVTGFQKHKTAASYLASLPGVMYLPDDLVYTIEEVQFKEKTFPEMDKFGIDLRRNRMIASAIEEKHARAYQNLVNENGHVHAEYIEWIIDSMDAADTPIMVYCNHATVAKALYRTLRKTIEEEIILVTGDDSTSIKEMKLKQMFLSGEYPILVGTASLATGTDGIDKVCDTLIILDDTEDDSLRRQLIGRIMPRGKDADATRKRILRAVLT